MRIITPVIYAVLFGTAIYAAIAQTSLPFTSAATDDSKPAVLAYAEPSDGTSSPAVSKPLRLGKREMCRQTVSAKKLGRREARDQLQLCVAQARVECLQQAIEQKVRAGTQRRVFVKGCLAG
ncbi:MAG: hypothetical protein EKK40_12150 [Bradyrhizobiaceae bacterium]|nr:MAG: hypothetical protein EKK40_12150 [Bradyrhizobiaceae bacterium]